VSSVIKGAAAKAGTEQNRDKGCNSSSGFLLPSKVTLSGVARGIAWQEQVHVQLIKINPYAGNKRKDRRPL